jgi:hypothetical protein
MRRSVGSIGCWCSTQQKSVRALTEPLRCASVSFGRSHHFLMIARLTKAQHRVLRRILIEQLDDALTHIEKPDPDLQALLERLHDVSYARAVQDDIEEAQAGMARHLRRARPRY